MQATKTGKTSIGLADVFRPEAIIVGLDHSTKQGVLVGLVHHLVEFAHLGEGAEKVVLQEILAREKLGSTGFGNGIAFPHCRTSVTDKFIGVLGLGPDGVPFEAIDGDPVNIVFLLLAPLEEREQLYEILGRLTAIGRDKSLRIQLRGCRTPAAVHHFLQELDRQ